MKTSPPARPALKLGLVLGAFAALAASAQLAGANVSESASLHARLKPLAKGLDGDWTNAGLARALGVAPAQLASPVPGAIGSVDFAPNPLLFGDRPQMTMPDLSVDTAKTINEGVPFSTGPIPAARPFVLTGSADDRAKALTCLTQAVYYEAGFEPMEGERAVAQVVLNRMRHPIFPHTVCGVVYQGSSQTTGCQFSFTCDGALHRGAPGAVAWDRARTVASAALNGYVQPAVGMATHYHTDYVAPYWMTTVTKLTKIGQHIFYRWPGTLGSPGAFFARYAGGERIAPTPNPTGLDATGVVLASASTPDGRVHAQLAVDGGADAAAAEAAKPQTPFERRKAWLAEQRIHGLNGLPPVQPGDAAPAAAKSPADAALSAGEAAPAAG